MRMLILLLASTSIIAAGCSSNQQAASTAPAGSQAPTATSGAMPTGGLASAAVLASPDDVRAVQNRLRQLNFYNGDASGAWSTDTEAAVQGFQRNSGLPVGRLDQTTLRAMGLNSVALGGGRLTDVALIRTPPAPMAQAPAPQATPPVASIAPAAGPGPAARVMMGRELDRASVRDVQQRLADDGFYKIKVDGIWGPKSQDGLVAFQRSRSLSADGRLTPETVSALRLDPNALHAKTR